MNIIGLEIHKLDMVKDIPNRGPSLQFVKSNDRNEIISGLARNKIIPVKSPNDSGMDFTLRRMGSEIGGNKHTMGKKTTIKLIRKLGVKTDADCERVREEIKNHPAWD